MKKLSFSVVFDGIFIGIVSFFVAFVMFYASSLRSGATPLAVTVALLSTMFGVVLLSKKQGAIFLKKQEKQRIDELINGLCLSSRAETTAHFEQALIKSEIPYKKTPKGLLLTGKNLLLCPYFSFDGITKAEILRAYNKLSGTQTALVLSDDFSPETRQFASKFDGKVKLAEKQTTYFLFKKANYTPDFSVKLKTSTPSFWERLRTSITKRRSGSYLLFGLSLVGLSFLTPYKVYYLLFGGVLLCLSVATLFLSKKPSEINYFY